ncbi:MAG: glycosyltransferase [Nitrosopumilaceae archaeon]|nr:glycosyltransferase [Nitrosopumilaceae archaeon]
MWKTILVLVEGVCLILIYSMGFFVKTFTLISSYGILIALYSFTQIIFSYLNERRYKLMNDAIDNHSDTSKHTEEEERGEMETIEIVDMKQTERQNVILIVGKRENPAYWDKCLVAVKNIKDNILDIFIIIDGREPEDEDMYIKALRFFQRGSYHIQPKIFRIDSSGKRGAMHYGCLKIREYYPDLIPLINMVTLDSDSEPEPDFMKYIVSSFQDESVACATGNLSIYNIDDSLLTRIVNARYMYAFNIERAASSYFGCMTCCSGPCSIYRLDKLTNEVMDDFINQRICNSKCEPGDDRHLTTLLLMKGFRSAQNTFAKCKTESPADLHRFLHQQLRWFRSFYREIPWQVRCFPKQHIYLGITSIYEYLFPVFVIFFTGYVLLIPRMWEYIIPSFLIASVSVFIKVIMIMIRLSSFTPIYIFLYMPLYYTLLLPTKLYAMMTICNNYQPYN